MKSNILNYLGDKKIDHLFEANLNLNAFELLLLTGNVFTTADVMVPKVAIH